MTPQEYEDVRQEVLAVCREKVAAMMLRLSIATGHGDTIDDLLCELENAEAAKFAALVDELTDANVALHAARAEIARLREHDKTRQNTTKRNTAWWPV